MKSNTDKCYLLVNTKDKVNIRVNNIDICNSKCEKLLGDEFDHKLNFGDRISELWKKDNRKIHALVTATSYMNILKRRILNAFLRRNLVIALSYRRVPIVLTTRKTTDFMTVAYELLITKNSHHLTSYLGIHNFISIHHRNLQSLAIGIYIVSNGLSPILRQESFMPNNEPPYNLRHLCQFKTHYQRVQKYRKCRSF